jgi:lipoate-protein ligase A
MARTKNKEWLLIVDRVPLNGSWNMAVDDYLFHSLPESPSTYLRFYRWQRPTVSLGYSQNIRRVVDLKYCEEQGVDIVRRMTGGKLVLHHKEVTYSVCSSDGETFTSKLVDSYRLISEALMRGLRRMGLKPCLADAPPDSYLRGNLPCFSYPARNEVEVNGKKIIGSAQKRAGSRFIQHGSIPLEEDEGGLNAVSFLKGEESLLRMTSLSQALGKTVSFDWAVEHFISGISEFFGVKLRPKIFDDAEKRVILSIEKERYLNKDWTFNRKSRHI